MLKSPPNVYVVVSTVISSLTLKRHKESPSEKVLNLKIGFGRVLTACSRCRAYIT